MVPGDEQQVMQELEQLAEDTVVEGLRNTTCTLAGYLGSTLMRDTALRNRIEAALGHLDAALDGYDAREKLPRARS